MNDLITWQTMVIIFYGVIMHVKLNKIIALLGEEDEDTEI